MVSGECGIPGGRPVESNTGDLFSKLIPVKGRPAAALITKYCAPSSTLLRKVKVLLVLE
jgi:hypothetical protein